MPFFPQPLRPASDYDLATTRGKEVFFTDLMNTAAAVVQKVIREFPNLPVTFDGDDVWSRVCESVWTRLLSIHGWYDAHGLPPVLAYIRKIAVSQCLKALRSDQQQPRASNQNVEPGAVAASDPHRYFEVTSDLDRAMDILTPQQQRVLISISQGYKYEEVATKYAISIETVKDHASNGRKRLRRFYGDQ